jgi:starch-binding outer membrane protein, SusD/RagB family
MKKISFILATLIFLGTSCSEDFLDIQPLDAVNSETYYQTEDQVRRALNGAYSPLGNRGMYGWWLSSIRDVLTDEAETLEQNIINHYFFNYNNTDIRLFNRTNGDGLWNSLYMGVLRSNLIIVRLPQSRIASAQVRGQLMGEAKFLRALYYFHLVNFWNRAPLLLDDNFNSFDVAAVDANAIYAAIERDLDDIIQGNLLPWVYSGGEGQEIGRASMGAARALRAKAHLYRGQYAEAAALFKSVIDQGVYDLLPLEQVFTLAGDNGVESVFEVQFNFRGAGFNPFFDDGVNASESSLRNQMLAPNQVGGWENVFPAPAFVAAFEEGDQRKKYFIIVPGDTITTTGQVYDPARNKGNFAIRKGVNSGFAAWNPQNGVADENFPIIRYADVLLMYAEALIQGGGNQQEAKDLIDRVRARAFQYANIAELRSAGKGVDDYMQQKGVSLMDALKHERWVELCYEGHRYLDLLRWGDLPGNTVLLNRGWRPEQTYYPIPQEDIDLSTLLTP